MIKLALAALVVVAGCQSSSRIVRPRAVTFTRPAPVNEVQDCAFWVNPADPAKSLILVTNERRGLEVHNLDGILLKHLDQTSHPQYVDVIYGVDVEGTPTDFVLITSNSEDTPGVLAFAINGEKGKLVEEPSPAMKTFGGMPPLGLFTYKSEKTGEPYFFVTDALGHAEQHEIVIESDGKPTSKVVRKFDTSAKSKGGVADAAAGKVYFAVDKIGIERYDAEPDASAKPTTVIKVNENGLIANARGPALFEMPDGGGYLVVLSQGAKGGHSVAHVYDRRTYKHLATIDPSPGSFGPLDHASGLDVSSRVKSTRFPGGVLAINDQITDNGSENFQLFSWAEIAKAAGLHLEATSHSHK